MCSHIVMAKNLTMFWQSLAFVWIFSISLSRVSPLPIDFTPGSSTINPPGGGISASILDQVDLTDANTTRVAQLLTSVNPRAYLEKYGYLPPGASPEEESQAITLFQEKSHLAVSGRIDISTLEQMTVPRCELEDILPANNVVFSKFFTGNATLDGSDPDVADPFNLAPNGGRWRTKALSWKIASYTSDLSQTSVHSTIAKAWKAWSDVSGLSFTEARSSQSSDFVINFHTRSHGDGAPFDGPGGVLAHAFYPRDGRAHFDDDETWSLSANRGGVNLEWVAIHEFGHSLGLAHSDVRDAVMYPYYPGFVSSISLRSDDIRGIQTLYGRNTHPATTEKPETTTRPRTTTTDSNQGGDRSPLFPNGRSPRGSVCPTKFSAIFRDEFGFPAFIDKRNQLWTFEADGLNPIRPQTIESIYPYWPRQPDAATIMESGTALVFNDYFVASFEAGRTRPEYFYNYQIGLPTSIDAVAQYSKNSKIYAFKDDSYWRLNAETLRVDTGYPRRISRGFPGLPDNLDAVFSYLGDLFMVRNNQYWRFSASNNKFLPGYPRSISFDFFNCGENPSNIFDEP